MAVDRLQGLSQGVAVKPACRVATTGNVTLSGLQTIDGKALAENDRVLVWQQDSLIENGIYIADTSSWSRATDFDGSRDVVRGTAVFVTEGDQNANEFFKVAADSTKTNVAVGADQITIETIPFQSTGGLTDEQTAEIAKLEHFVRPEDYDGSESSQFQQALASGKHVLIGAGPYSIEGEFDIASGTTVEFQGSTINMTLDGENGRGFRFPDGVTDARITGTATINATCETNGSDGSRNGVFSFGGDFYLTSDPSGTLRCSIDGSFRVESIGTANCKIVQMYGYVEDCYVKGVTGLGQTNFCFAAHWAGNGTTLAVATKTWAPHRITFENCVAFQDGINGNNLRGFTASGCGNIIFRHCVADSVTVVGFNMFVGDYGAQFAQNFTEEEALNYSIVSCTYNGPTTAISGDGLSARLLDSAQWAGWEHNASLYVHDFRATMDDDADGLAIAVSFYKNLTFIGLSYRERWNGNSRSGMQITSVENLYVQGDIVAQKTCLMRGISNLHWDANIERYEYDPTVSAAALTGTAVYYDVTTTAESAAGATTVTIDDIEAYIGPGGYLQYTTGGRTYEAELTTTTTGTPVAETLEQTIGVTELPVTIPSGASVRIIQTVKNMYVGPVSIKGSETGVELGGDAIARPRRVFLNGTAFSHIGFIDVDVNACEQFVAQGTIHSKGGKGGSLSSRCILIGDDVEGFSVNNVQGDEFCHGIRYLVEVSTGAENGTVDGPILRSVSSTATSPAVVFCSDPSAQNVAISNVIAAAGITPLHPAPTAGSTSGVPDDNYGDVTVSSSGTVWTVTKVGGVTAATIASNNTKLATVSAFASTYGQLGDDHSSSTGNPHGTAFSELSSQPDIPSESSEINFSSTADGSTNVLEALNAAFQAGQPTKTNFYDRTFDEGVYDNQMEIGAQNIYYISTALPGDEARVKMPDLSSNTGLAWFLNASSGEDITVFQPTSSTEANVYFFNREDGLWTETHQVESTYRSLYAIGVGATAYYVIDMDLGLHRLSTANIGTTAGSVLAGDSTLLVDPFVLNAEEMFASTSPTAGKHTFYRNFSTDLTISLPPRSSDGSVLLITQSGSGAVNTLIEATSSDGYFRNLLNSKSSAESLNIESGQTFLINVLPDQVTYLQVAPSTAAGSSADLGLSQTTSDVTITNTAGDNVTIPEATTTAAGMLGAVTVAGINALSSQVEIKDVLDNRAVCFTAGQNFGITTATSGEIWTFPYPAAVDFSLGHTLKFGVFFQVVSSAFSLYAHTSSGVISGPVVVPEGSDLTIFSSAIDISAITGQGWIDLFLHSSVSSSYQVRQAQYLLFPEEL